MSFWTAIVVIAAIWGFVTMVRSRHNTEARFLGDDQDNPPAIPRREEELERELQQLRERIQVLERIATDDREAKRLSAEIDELRRN